MISVIEPHYYWPETSQQMFPFLVEHVERCGRVCYRSEERITEGSATRFVETLRRSGHESVLEHASLTAIVVCSRACSHQLVRHRIAAYCIDGEAETILTCQGQTGLGRAFRYYKRRKIRELFAMTKTPHGRSRLKLVKLNCLDEATGRIVQGQVQDVIYTGRKSCIEITTEDGFQLRATRDHRFFTPVGWKRLEEVLEEKLQVAVNGVSPPSREWIQKEYIDKNRTRQELANELGMSEAWLGKIIAQYGLQKPAAKRPNRKPGCGKKGMFSETQRRQFSEQKQDSKNPQWKGGITPEGNKLRAEKVTLELRKEVYQRDDYTCRLCNKHGGKLELHHIVPVWQNQELIDEPKNLVTLCVKCHDRIQNHEHEYAEYFCSLEPIQPRPAVKQCSEYDIAHFVSIVTHQEIGEIDTYDIVMRGQHHNFIANKFIVHNSQESQRYCNYGKQERLLVVCPPGIGVVSGDYESYGTMIRQGGTTIDLSTRQTQWIHHVCWAYEEYKRELAEGLKPEDARYILPNATKTELAVTFNLRQWRHVFKERALNRHAQWEIRNIFSMILEDLLERIPVVFDDLRGS